MSAESLTPYGELAAVIDNLPLLVREARRARGLSLRAAGEQVGLAYTVLARVENGQHTMQAHSVAAILRWLDTKGADA